MSFNLERCGSQVANWTIGGRCLHEVATPFRDEVEYLREMKGIWAVVDLSDAPRIAIRRRGFTGKCNSVNGYKRVIVDTYDETARDADD